MSKAGATNPFPSEMWVLSEAVTDEPGFKLLHTQIIARLRDEIPGIENDTLGLMLLERVVTLYVTIRSKEAKKSFAHDRAYKETLQLWAQMSGDLRKGRGADAAVTSAVTNTVSDIAMAIHDALQNLDVPNEVKIKVLESVSSALDE